VRDGELGSVTHDFEQRLDDRHRPEAREAECGQEQGMRTTVRPSHVQATSYFARSERASTISVMSRHVSRRRI
jgi:hypothetical protein